jgi:nicotinamidase-related amidase
MRRDLPDRLPLETALIVIDVQKAIDHSSWGERNNPDAEQNIAALLGAWRSRTGPFFTSGTIRPNQILTTVRVSQATILNLRRSLWSRRRSWSKQPTAHSSALGWKGC